MTVERIDPLAPITLTDAAIKYFGNYVPSNGAIGVKLSLRGGGCAGFAYDWDMISEYSEQEEKYVQQYDNFVFILAENSYNFLVGSTVDLEDLGIKGTQIVVHSPKQASACGCGESITFNE